MATITVKNVQPRLIRLDGVFLAPGEEVAVHKSAVGLDRLLARGVLVKVTQAEPQEIKGAVEAEAEAVTDTATPKSKGKKADNTE